MLDQAERQPDSLLRARPLTLDEVPRALALGDAARRQDDLKANRVDVAALVVEVVR